MFWNQLKNISAYLIFLGKVTPLQELSIFYRSDCAMNIYNNLFENGIKIFLIKIVGSIFIARINFNIYDFKRQGQIFENYNSQNKMFKINLNIFFILIFIKKSISKF
jgi:hypothetical protein